MVFRHKIPWKQGTQIQSLSELKCIKKALLSAKYVDMYLPVSFVEKHVIVWSNDETHVAKETIAPAVNKFQNILEPENTGELHKQQDLFTVIYWKMNFHT